MSSAADKLNKLKVADLKPILAKVGLPVSGKKNELVDRILASKEALAAAGFGEESAPAAEADVNVDLPDLPQVEEPTVSTTIPTPAPAAAPPASEPPTSTATTTATDAPQVDDEVERRRKRAERFGIPFVDEQKKPAAPAKPAAASKAPGPKPAATNANPASPEDLEKMRKRAERFGVPLAAPGATSNGRTKSAAKETAPAVAVAVAVDPAEEEKKRKRAERFGKVAGAPLEKKAKADS